MQVAGHYRRLDLQKFLQVTDGLAKSVKSGLILEITDMLTDEGLLAAGQADRCLQLGSDRQDLPGVVRQKHRPRHVATRTTVKQGPPLEDPQHGIIGTDLDRAVVSQNGVGNAGQAADRLVIGADHRHISCVGTGHHQRGQP